MCRADTCCCRFTLRMGSYVSAGYTIVLGAVLIVIYAAEIALVVAREHEIERRFRNETGARWKMGDHLQNTRAHGHINREHHFRGRGLHVVEYIMIVDLVAFALWIASGIILAIGTFKSIRALLMPWIVVTIISTVLCGLHSLAVLFAAKRMFSTPAAAAGFVFSLPVVVINIYCLVVVFSFFYNKCSEPGDDMATPIVNENDCQQTPTSAQVPDNEVNNVKQDQMAKKREHII